MIEQSWLEKAFGGFTDNEKVVLLAVKPAIDAELKKRVDNGEQPSVALVGIVGRFIKRKGELNAEVRNQGKWHFPSGQPDRRISKAG